MPANLTPEFLKARERFRAAQTPREKLAALEEMLATIPKHKGTDKMQADIKRRIAKLRETEQASHKKGRRTGPDHIDREGAGQVVLVGPPNSGKSSLLAAVTNARPEIADYPFSTLIPVPGMMEFEDVAIQLIDLPPVTTEYTEPWVYSLVRQADLVLLVIDTAAATAAAEEIMLILEDHHLRLVAAASGETDARIRDVPCRIVVTKTDLAPAPPTAELAALFPVISVSATTGTGLEQLRAEVFRALNIIRIYTKLPGKPPDLTEPYTLPAGSTVHDAVIAVHREFADKLKYVRVWGSGRFPGQQVPTDHVLADKDVIEIHLA